MGANGIDEYWVPEHVKEYLRKLGFVLPLDDMEPWIRSWDDWMSARGDFYDYRDKDGMGRVYEVHRRSIHPAMRICKEWGSLLLNEDVKVVSENQAVTDWLGSFFSSANFMSAAQATVVRAFGLGTGAWALWLDLDHKKVRIRHYDARMVIPITWDENGVTECAFVTRAFYRGKAVDQLQMHLRGGGEFFSPMGGTDNTDPLVLDADTYRIVTVFFDHEGNELLPVGVSRLYDTGCPYPTFGIVRPAVTNTRVDMSPYGQSVSADAVDAVQAMDLTFDALVNEVDLSKMRVFLSDVLFDRSTDGNKTVTIPFGRQDCTVFRKVMSTEDTIQELAPALRTGSQIEAFRVSLQMLGDLCGFGNEHARNQDRVTYSEVGCWMDYDADHLPEWVWCLVGNVVDEHPFGPDHHTVRGMSHFSPGTKVYCFPSQWGDGYEKIPVLGRHKGKHGFIKIVMWRELIENFRCQKVYSPNVIRRMYLGGNHSFMPWGNSERDYYDVMSLVEWLSEPKDVAERRRLIGVPKSFSVSTHVEGYPEGDVTIRAERHDRTDGCLGAAWLGFSRIGSGGERSLGVIDTYGYWPEGLPYEEVKGNYKPTRDLAMGLIDASVYLWDEFYEDDTNPARHPFTWSIELVGEELTVTSGGVNAYPENLPPLLRVLEAWGFPKIWDSQEQAPVAQLL